MTDNKNTAAEPSHEVHMLLLLDMLNRKVMYLNVIVTIATLLLAGFFGFFVYQYFHGLAAGLE